MDFRILLPLGSAILWALSVPVVRIGLKRIKEENNVPYLLTGLLISLLSGSFTLIIWERTVPAELLTDTWILLAGIFTFPIGTGLYYLCGAGMKNRLDVAAQFTKVKPVFSILVALTLLQEKINSGMVIAAIITFCGTALLLKYSLLSGASPKAFILGLGTALFWVAGESCVKIGFPGSNNMTASFSALLAGTLVGLICIGPYAFCRVRFDQLNKVMLPFALHGVISFGIAYPLFFWSINELGLTKTVVINAFWPSASIFIVYAFDKYLEEQVKLESELIAAGGLLLAGSVGAILISI